MDIVRAAAEAVVKNTLNNRALGFSVTSLSGIEALRAALAQPVGEQSDGYHTFNELYAHRVTLFIALCKRYQGRSWRSLKHSDGTMFDGWFIMGIDKEPEMQITYHLPMSEWPNASFAETISSAPLWDGHTPSDVLIRIRNLAQPQPSTQTIYTQINHEREPHCSGCYNFTYEAGDTVLKGTCNECGELYPALAQPESELKSLQEEIHDLREAISPHRVNVGKDYYVGVAKRMRKREPRIHANEVQPEPLVRCRCGHTKRQHPTDGRNGVCIECRCNGFTPEPLEEPNG